MKHIAVKGITNNFGIGIVEIDELEDVVKHTYSDEPNKIIESDLQWNDEGEPYFLDRWEEPQLLNEFIRI